MIPSFILTKIYYYKWRHIQNQLYIEYHNTYNYVDVSVDGLLDEGDEYLFNFKTRAKITYRKIEKYEDYYPYFIECFLQNRNQRMIKRINGNNFFPLNYYYSNGKIYKDISKKKLDQ